MGGDLYSKAETGNIPKYDYNTHDITVAGLWFPSASLKCSLTSSTEACSRSARKRNVCILVGTVRVSDSWESWQWWRHRVSEDKWILRVSRAIVVLILKVKEQDKLWRTYICKTLSCHFYLPHKLKLLFLQRPKQSKWYIPKNIIVHSLTAMLVSMLFIERSHQNSIIFHKCEFL